MNQGYSKEGPSGIYSWNSTFIVFMNPTEKDRNAAIVSLVGDAEVSRQLFPKKSHIAQ